MGLVGLSGTPDGLGCPCAGSPDGLGACPPILRIDCASAPGIVQECLENPRSRSGCCSYTDPGFIARVNAQCGASLEASGSGGGMPTWGWIAIGVGVLGAGYLIATRKKGRR